MDKIVLGIIIGFFFIAFLLFFCVVLIRLYFTKIKSYTRQLYQKDLDFQKALTTTVIETQEQVLNNISQDLHDDAGQQLTYINFQIENLKLDSPELQEALAPLSQSVGLLSQSVRSISHSLNNQLLLQQDVIKAMAAETERLQKNAKAQLNFTFEEKVHKHFTANEKIFIYRIFQEALNNCFKHAKAGVIDINVSTKPQFKMVIADNGRGFDSATVRKSKSLGLPNMINRAESIGYDITIISRPDEGTNITLTEKPS